VRVSETVAIVPTRSGVRIERPAEHTKEFTPVAPEAERTAEKPERTSPEPEREEGGEKLAKERRESGEKVAETEAAAPPAAPSEIEQLESQIPPLYFTKTRVPVQVWIESEAREETVELTAREALDDVLRERAAYQRLLDCLKGGGA